jgi:MraZ protein
MRTVNVKKGIVSPFAENQKGGMKMASFFYGSYEHQLDDKNRFRIPAKFRKALVGEDGTKTYTLARGMLDGCIYVLPEDQLEMIMEKLSDEKMGEASVATMLFFSSMHEAEEDPQGRVVLPPHLKTVAGIDKDIVTVGRGKRIEIWAADVYEKMCSNVNYKVEFKKLGI